MQWLDENELLVLKGAGGLKFARFVDLLIRAEAHAGGLAQSEIDTQLRVNIADGGVDTRVRKSIPADRSGFLDVPTCWQFKAETAAELKKKRKKNDPYPFLTQEIRKSAVQSLIKDGHAFRFCFVGDLPPIEVQNWEGHLLTECQKISTSALPPRVVAGDQLAVWAQRFPAVVQFIRPITGVWNLDVWQSNIRATTKEYVPYDGWLGVTHDITTHSVSTQVIDPCLSIQGEAGVGKTRLVFETLAALPESAGLAIYTRDEQVALALSQQLATDVRIPHAIVVADECTLQKRMMIQQNLAGCGDRVRFICLSNTGERGVSGAPEIWLEELPDKIVTEVLKRNFPNVPAERRQAYADFAGGFIQLSADMCAHDDELAAQGDFRPILNKVADYVEFRIREASDRDVINALALFTSVGAKGDVAVQLESLSELVGISVQEFTRIAEKIKDAPGFISIAGRYLYVTPSIVANVAFTRGWKTWVRDDVRGFVAKLDPSLVPSFLNRVRSVGTEEVRAAVGETFREWISKLNPEDLDDLEKVLRLSTLVETDPERYLPLLRALIERAPGEILRTGNPFGASTRRQLVWLCERLAAFSQLYADCEAILFRLAVEESEPRLGNNATGIWSQLQRIVLSGSSVPFQVRFEVFRKRVNESNGAVYDLCLKAFSGIFASEVTRMGAPATIGGRLRPLDWHPANQDETREYWKNALEFLTQLAESSDHVRANKATKIALEHLHAILNAGFAQELAKIFRRHVGDIQQLTEIVEKIEDYISWERKREAKEFGGSNQAMLSYLDEVAAWLDTIRPTSFSGRLRTLLSRSHWNSSVYDTDGKLNEVVLGLASEALRNRATLREELPFLMSDAAKSANAFGDALGRLDSGEQALSTIFEAVKVGGNFSLALGYVFGRMREASSASDELRRSIAQIGTIDAKVEFELRAAGGDKLDFYSHALRAVDEGKLSAAVLARFAFERPSLERIKEILSRFAGANVKSPEVWHGAIQFLSIIGHRETGSIVNFSIQDKEVRDLIWGIIACTPIKDSKSDEYEWSELLKQFAPFDPSRATKLLMDASLSETYADLHDYSFRALVSLAPAHPREIVDRFGIAMLDEKDNVKLRVGDGASMLLSVLPWSAVVDWVHRNGIHAMRAVARELPLPFVNKNDEAIVPEVTAKLLGEFGGDEETREGFIRRSFRGDSWMGNGGEYFAAKAKAARRFLLNDNLCVRQWAEQEVSRSEAMAKIEQTRHEERVLE
jgi:hypothetical protein